jgi:hypothetical protein
VVSNAFVCLFVFIGIGFFFPNLICLLFVRLLAWRNSGLLHWLSLLRRHEPLRLRVKLWIHSATPLEVD